MHEQLYAIVSATQEPGFFVDATPARWVKISGQDGEWLCPRLGHRVYRAKDIIRSGAFRGDLHIWTVETPVGVEIVEGDRGVDVSSARLVDRCHWDVEVAVLYGCECAERLLRLMPSTDDDEYERARRLLSNVRQAVFRPALRGVIDIDRREMLRARSNLLGSGSVVGDVYECVVWAAQEPLSLGSVTAQAVETMRRYVGDGAANVEERWQVTRLTQWLHGRRAWL